ncbi:hypothetical protein CPB86DRAFT_800839 [Serendipita vermifera]|nr:hypothetical protein CPB86DRAFT_800839 [Serendipita vermifera]
MNTTNTRMAVFDDTHPNITYHSGRGIFVTPEKLSLAMNGTGHGISGVGGGFTVQFTGDRIGIFGGLFGTSWTECRYVLDDLAPVVVLNNITAAQRYLYGPAIYTAQFYESPVLEYGAHILNATITGEEMGTPYIVDKPYVLDFLTIGIKDDGEPNMFIVDSADPAVEYDGFLREEYTSGYEYKLTLDWSDSAGASAKFKFNGTTIQVYGAFSNSVSDPTPMVSFHVDDGDESTYYSFNTGGVTVSKRLLYSQTGLSEGPHTLHVRSLTSLRYSIDYILYKSSLNNSPSSRSPTVPVAPIAGGVIGGVTGLTLLVLLFIIYRRRRTVFNGESHLVHGYTMENASASPLVPGSSNPSTGAILSRNAPLQSPQIAGLHRSRSDSALSDWYTRGEEYDGREQQVDNTITTRLQGNILSRQAGPLPQKYRLRRENIVEVSEHNSTDIPAYTGTDLRSRSSPPPSYSGL